MNKAKWSLGPVSTEGSPLGIHGRIAPKLVFVSNRNHWAPRINVVAYTIRWVTGLIVKRANNGCPSQARAGSRVACFKSIAKIAIATSSIGSACYRLTQAGGVTEIETVRTNNIDVQAPTYPIITAINGAWVGIGTIGGRSINAALEWVASLKAIAELAVVAIDWRIGALIRQSIAVVIHSATVVGVVTRWRCSDHAAFLGITCLYSVAKDVVITFRIFRTEASCGRTATILAPPLVIAAVRRSSASSVSTVCARAFPGAASILWNACVIRTETLTRAARPDISTRSASAVGRVDTAYSRTETPDPGSSSLATPGKRTISFDVPVDTSNRKLGKF